ncbi:MAG: response regulator [Gammaproteobacteria bacterium]|jgi:CheY-like chemotaxis protein
MDAQNQMLSCFFPTTVVFIDDNTHHLETMLSTIDMEHSVPKLFSNPVEAVTFINNHPSILKRSSQVRFDNNIKNFHKKLLGHADQRFRELSVVICDYAMPQRNGLEVLQDIKNRELKTIMLTGEASESLAIEAFNRGLIDHFLRKEVPNFAEVINTTILGLQKDFIHRETGILVENIALGKLPNGCVLTDPTFMRLFNEVRRKFQIIEYYLLDEQGSYLLMNQKGQIYFLAILDAVDLDAHTQFAIEEQAPQNIIEALQTKKFMPFFYSEEDAQTPPADWATFLHPVHMLKGNDTYYYSLIPPAKIHHPKIHPNQTYEYFLEHAHG